MGRQNNQTIKAACKRVPRKGAPTVETPRGASLRRRPRPCSLRRPAGAPWHLGSSSPPRRRPTGRLYSGTVLSRPPLGSAQKQPPPPPALLEQPVEMPPETGTAPLAR